MLDLPEVGLIFSVIAAHWVADFVLQTHWQASNKSKNWDALTQHVTTYTLAMAVMLCWLFTPRTLGAFVGITLIAHFMTDAITSRITSRLYAKQHWHNFFVVVGFDQLLHYTQLFLTISLLG
jgi:hypothetical protein